MVKRKSKRAKPRTETPKPKKAGKPVKLAKRSLKIKKHTKIGRLHSKKAVRKREHIKTGIRGFDRLFEKGIPEKSAVLVAGGAGSGKTIMGLQILHNAAREGKKCLYMSFEESEGRLREHMENFGWNPHELEKKGRLKLQMFNTFDINRSLEALMAKAEGDLLIDIKPIVLPHGFRPDVVVVDSLTAIASAFRTNTNYRSYIENLFRYFENLGVTSFLITETEQVPTVYSPTGVEEFLADGVIVLYNVRKGDIRENAIEVLKMRGTKHVKKIVAMRVSKSGMEVFPDQEVFSGI